MNFGSLFTGIGGIDLGLEWAGMTCNWQNEIDEYCLKVLEKLWPNVLKYRDVRDVGRHNLEPVDLIAGGFPCQPHSVAGKREGAKDNRNLWPEFIRVISEMRPRYVLAENVPGIITTYLDTVLSDLENQGYTCGTFNIPACAFDAPHRRERIFIVAYSLRERNGSIRQRIDPRTQNQRGGNSQERREALCPGQETSFASDPEACGEIVADAESWENDERRREDLAGAPGERGRGDASAGVGRKDVSDSSLMQRSPVKRDEQDRILSEVLADTEVISERTRSCQEGQGGKRGGRLGDEDGDVPNTSSRRLSERDRIFSQRQEADSAIEAYQWWSVEPRLGELVDGLSPELAGRFIRVAKGCPDRVNKLRALGNAVVPQVAEWIGRRIMEHEEIMGKIVE